MMGYWIRWPQRPHPDLSPSLPSRAPVPIPFPDLPGLPRSIKFVCYEQMARRERGGGGKVNFRPPQQTVRCLCEQTSDPKSRCFIPLVVKLSRSYSWYSRRQRAGDSDRWVPGKTDAAGSWWLPFVRRPSKNTFRALPHRRCWPMLSSDTLSLESVCKSLTGPNRKSQ